MLIAQAPISIDVTIPAAAEHISCPAVGQMLRKGYENPVEEVSNVQKVLRDIEHMDVAVTGDFDDETEAAVMKFQEKYPEVLGPWGTTHPTGVVSLTTGKKINQLACAAPLTLNGEEMRFIDVVRQKAQDVDAQNVASSDSNSVQSALVPNAPESAAAGAAYPYNDDDTANDSLIGRFGSYLKGLFR